MAAEVRDRHTCSACAKHFLVVYSQLDPDEPSRNVPIACPHCQALNHVPVASSAALASHYWSERVSQG